MAHRLFGFGSAASRLALVLAASFGAGSASGQVTPDMGKLTATGGVSQVEGAGGGGLTPWALIAGYGSRDSWGANAHVTRVATQDYSLASYGVMVGLFDRVELSLATQDFRGSLAPLNDLRIKQDIVGLKVKLVGDAVYDQDLVLPQIAVGVMAKRNKGVGGLGALGVTKVTQLGAKDESGVDYYVAATSSTDAARPRAAARVSRTARVSLIRRRAIRVAQSLERISSANAPTMRRRAKAPKGTPSSALKASAEVMRARAPAEARSSRERWRALAHTSETR